MATDSDINKVYREKLGRDAGKSGMDYYKKRISSGESINDISRSIAASPEAKKYSSRSTTNGGSSGSSSGSSSRRSTSSRSGSSKNSISSNDINKIYRETLGRDAGKAGIDYWTKNASKGFSLDDIKKGVQNSEEYKTRSLLQLQSGNAPDGWFDTTNKRNRYTDGQQRATDYLNDGFTPQVSYSDNSSNLDFIKAVYQNETGRDADQSGLSYWQDMMSKGMRRDEVIKAFNSSQEGIGYDNPLLEEEEEFVDASSSSSQSPQTSVNPRQTSQYQLQQMLDSNSPLMQQAATMGNQRANSRGLLNSSMASQAAQAAMISAATPFAQQDAQTYFQGDQANADRRQQEFMSRLGYQQQRGLNEQQYGFQRGLNEQQYGFQRGLNEQGYEFDLGRMQQEYGFNSQLSTQEASQSLNQLYATSTANGWGVMANNLTDIIGQYSGQLERIQMNPDIGEEQKTSLIQQVLSMRDADLDFQRSMYDQLPNYLANTGVFPNR